MRLVLIGCEYAGKATLAAEVSKWMIEAMGLPFVRWHNHFVLPYLDQHLAVRAEAGGPEVVPGKTADDTFDDEDLEQITRLRPMVLEQFQRHMVWRHPYAGDFEAETDFLAINFYYADAVYAPLYYGYGEPGSFADRRRRARAWDAELMKVAPDTVLVLMTASADVIRQRMRDSPRSRGILNEPEVELVLERFEDEYRDSLIPRRFRLDTTSKSPQESLQE